MSSYFNILVALDLTDNDEALITAAQNVASDVSNISLIHVCEAISYPADTYLGDIPIKAREDALAEGQRRFAELADKFDLPKQGHKVEIGRAATEIHRVADAEGVNLIVVGSHGRHGVQLLLGSTANAVLHGAKCDVLAVRLGKAAT